MNIIYNTQEKITSEIKKILLQIIPDIRKTQLKISPFIILQFISVSELFSSCHKLTFCLHLISFGAIIS